MFCVVFVVLGRPADSDDEGMALLQTHVNINALTSAFNYHTLAISIPLCISIHLCISILLHFDIHTIKLNTRLYYTNRCITSVHLQVCILVSQYGTLASAFLPYTYTRLDVHLHKTWCISITCYGHI